MSNRWNRALRSAANQSRPLCRRLAVLAATACFCTPAQPAIFDFLGFGFSENETYKEVRAIFDAAGNLLAILGEHDIIPVQPGIVVKVIGVVADVLDPPADDAGAILSGRLTVTFDPSYQLLAAGWYGEFGVNPNKPAPPVALPPADNAVDQLQLAPNAAMQSGSIVVEPGRVVFQFDWGPGGFVPTQYMDATGHFNFAGLYLYSPAFDGFAPGTPADFVTMVGTRQDVELQGTAAPTYMLCARGYCGAEPIPEPGTAWLLIAGGLLLAGVVAGRKAR